MAVNYYAPFGDGTYWRNITDTNDTTYGQIAVIDGKRKLVVGDKVGELCLVDGKRRYWVEAGPEPIPPGCLPSEYAGRWPLILSYFGGTYYYAGSNTYYGSFYEYTHGNPSRCIYPWISMYCHSEIDLSLMYGCVYGGINGVRAIEVYYKHSTSDAKRKELIYEVKWNNNGGAWIPGTSFQNKKFITLLEKGSQCGQSCDGVYTTHDTYKLGVQTTVDIIPSLEVPQVILWSTGEYGGEFRTVILQDIQDGGCARIYEVMMEVRYKNNGIWSDWIRLPKWIHAD